MSLPLSSRNLKHRSLRSIGVTIRRGAAVAALAMCCPMANAVSFDCAKAATFAEKAVCANSLLGKLDDTLSGNYKRMQAANIGDGARKHLRTTQQQWLTERNKCTTESCLVDAYRRRIDQICDYPVISGIHPICDYAADIK
jgi:uncharacterized protein